KGFSLARLRLAEGAFVDLYNVHTNADSTDDALAARRANVEQLSDFIQANSAGNAVIVMGDTNTRYTRTGDNIRTLLSENGLT
ncbi:endonuclease/exonuclease/phosphatase family protein, partial [Streptomyces afghaniensis]